LVLQNGETVVLEISDEMGVFGTNPLIGGVSPTYNGSIYVTFPIVSVTETRFMRLRATRQDGIIFLSDQVQIIINPRPQAIATANGPTTFCAGQSVTLSANTDPEIVTYLWSDGSSSSNIFETSVEVSSNANYTLTVTNTSGCSSISAPINVGIGATISNTISASGPTTFCEGGTVDLLSPILNPRPID
jgi:hypothetical protein